MFLRIVRGFAFLAVLVGVAGPCVAGSARIGVSRVRDMHFGAVTRDADTFGWIRLSPTGEVTPGGSAVLLTGPTGAAEFEVTGEPDAPFTISLPRRIKLGTGVKVRNLTSEPTDLGRLGPDGRATVRVGGKLKMGKDATAGALSASFRLRVHYL